MRTESLEAIMSEVDDAAATGDPERLLKMVEELLIVIKAVDARSLAVRARLEGDIQAALPLEELSERSWKKIQHRS